MFKNGGLQKMDDGDVAAMVVDMKKSSALQNFVKKTCRGRSHIEKSKFSFQKSELETAVMLLTA